MSKLEDFTKTAGMNAGASLYAKMVRTTDIQTDPELSGIFPVSDETLAAVTASMKERGYDRAEPVVVWKGRNIVVDGHTRLRAAAEAGIMEIPVEEKEFENIGDAVLYAYGRQANRRNLTQAEIYGAAVALKDKAERDGNGRAAEKLAELLNISESTIYRARAIDEKASPEVIEAVKNGDMSINRAYQQVKKRKTPPVEQPDNDYAPPGMEMETEFDEGTAPEGDGIPGSIDTTIPDDGNAFTESETGAYGPLEPEPEIGERLETMTSDPPERELPEISESINLVLPDDNGSFVETAGQPEGESEPGILAMLEQAIETLERFLENHEGEGTGELREALALLQKIHERYITGGKPS